MAMKKTLLLALPVLVMLFAACGKERQCKCTTTDVPDDGILKLMIVDNSMSCDDIKVMGVESTTILDDGTQSLKRTEMHTVSCRDYASN